MNMDGRKKRGVGLWAAAGILALAAGAAAEDKPASPPVTASKGVKLSGYIQLVSTTQSQGIDGFAMRRVRLSLAGEVVKNVKVKFQIDTQKSPIMLDAQIDWTPLEAASLRLGQFKIPFSLESLTSSADLDMIERSQVVDKLSPGWDIGANGRDVGVAVTGKVSFLEYALGGFNGAGINKTDTNGQKDFDARLLFRPLPNLAFGGSIYQGRYSAAAGARPVERDRYGLEAAWTTPTVSLKGEYIKAEDGVLNRDGWYLQGGWFVSPKKIQAVLRADIYDKDQNKAGDRSDLFMGGVNWFFSERTKLKANVGIYRTEAGTTANKVLLIQFQAGF